MNAVQRPETRPRPSQGIADAQRHADAEDNQEHGERLADERRPARRLLAIARRREQRGGAGGADVQRIRRDQVEDAEHDVDRAQPQQDGRERADALKGAERVRGVDDGRASQDDAPPAVASRPMAKLVSGPTTVISSSARGERGSPRMWATPPKMNRVMPGDRGRRSRARPAACDSSWARIDSTNSTAAAAAMPQHSQRDHSGGAGWETDHRPGSSRSAQKR